jgi:deazaflavin-dependent oxidoreductase (nitroreductase family)
MTRRKYSLANRIVQKTASTRPGAWFFARTLHRFDRLALKMSGNQFTLSSLLGGLPIVMVTTTGARSGLPRTLPLIAVLDETEPGKLALIATNWGQQQYPAWYYNLRAHPQATVSLKGQAAAYTAHEAEGDEYEKFWQAAAATYIGYPFYKERIAGGRRIPIMILTPA